MSAYFTNPLSSLTTKWRIFHEEAADLNPRDERTDFEELRGEKDTRIYRQVEGILAVSSDDSRAQIKLRRISGLRPYSGSVLLFPDALLDTVAEAITAKKRRQYTPEQIEALKLRTAHSRFQKKHGIEIEKRPLKPMISPENDQMVTAAVSEQF